MWAQIINTFIGLWLMVAPKILGYESVSGDNGHIIGPLVITFSVVSYWEATRDVRKSNYALGLWLLLSPWVLNYDQNSAIISDMAAGILLLIFASVQGNIKGRYAGGWSSLFKKSTQE
tara:strand:+ start:440 stop:793 length:354 start_codon:yes stop_codon:yes gene_type:complete